MRFKVDRPSELALRNNDLNFIIVEHLLHQFEFILLHARVVHSNAENKRLFQKIVAYLSYNLLDFILAAAQKRGNRLAPRVSQGDVDQVERRQPALLFRGDENQNGFIVGVFFDRVKGGFVHERHPSGVSFLAEALYMQVDGNRPHLGLEIEEIVGGDVEPLGHVGSVAHRRQQP